MTTPSEPEEIKGLAQRDSEDMAECYGQVVKWVDDWLVVQKALIWLNLSTSSIASEEEITAIDQAVNLLRRRLADNERRAWIHF